MAERTHKRMGWAITLPDVDQVTQRDLNKYMAAMRESKLGDSVTEMNNKMLWAGLKSGFVRATTPALAPEEIEAQPPALVRWFGLQINALYIEVTTIPPE